MVKKIDFVLENMLKEIEPSPEEKEFMLKSINDFLIKIKFRIEKLGLDVEPFVGGSFAKNTVTKKDVYDADIFFRFDKKYSSEEKIKLTKKILKKNKNVSKVHGSRDYFQVKITDNFYLEIVPVLKINSPKEAKNITDLSYSHVKYINKKVKSKKVLEGIKLAKAFCHSTKTYGAESYIQGFSGYALELLIQNYGGFEKFLRELSKSRKEKLVIDMEKAYKGKKEILLEMNGSKLISPIILIDPTYKERNVLAALSDETYELFKKKAKQFLKKPSKEMFYANKINFLKLKEKSDKEKKEFIVVKLKTKKQKGDVAGTKLLKFHRHLRDEFKKYFELSDTDFEYLKTKEGIGYFILKPKKEFIFKGPLKEDKKHAPKFMKEHNNFYIKKDRLYANKEINFTGKEFLKSWLKKHKKKVKEMYVTKVEIL